MKLTATMGDGSVDDTFLNLWLRDPHFLELEFREIIDA